MAASGAPAAAPARQPRRGPAPIASFDHDVSDESSPETKQSFRLPEIREYPAGGAGGADVSAASSSSLAPGEQRARSHSTPAATALAAPPTPRIDISRASSSSHHDSRDSSPEMALFAGTSDDNRQRLELGFREDGALDLRSSTEELAFLEPAPGEPRPAPAPTPAPPPGVPPPPPPPTERRHSRKDSQSSEAALLGVSGRTSRLSSVGSQCSAQSAMSRISRLSVVSGTSRSPSPHRMLLETSFCGPKPIETDPEICAAAVVEHILEIVKMSGGEPTVLSPPKTPEHISVAEMTRPAPTVDARDRREVRTEVLVENARSAPVVPTTVVVVNAPPPTVTVVPITDADKNLKETNNRVATDERKARPRMRREPSEPEVYKSRNRSKDIIRIKLKPDEDDEEEEDLNMSEMARKPVSLELGNAARPAEPPSPAPSRRRSPSPGGGPPVSRKSSFCSLFKSRETIASPDSPSEALRRKRSLTEGRSRSKSRDRSGTPSSAGKIRGSVLSLFRTPRRSVASPSPSSRDVSPGVVPHTRPTPTVTAPRRADKLKYYEDTKDGVIHIPLRTPPEERPGPGAPRRSSGAEAGAAEPAPPREPRPASAPQPRALPEAPPAAAPAEAKTQLPTKPIHRTVLPDGSIIIPLHSPTERATENGFPEPARLPESKPVSSPTVEEAPVGSWKEHESVSNRIDVPQESTAILNNDVKGIYSPTGSVDPVRPNQISPATPASPPQPEPPPPPHEDTRKRRKERLVFTTHVGSREQVFSTQFSITKTPSVTSEISGSFPSFAEGEEVRGAPPLRDTHIAAEPPAAVPADTAEGSAAVTPQDAPRDSSESEPSSEAAPPRAGNDVERRGLVVQESFEDDLPYVPTTLPQERPVALPMVPIRERGGVRVSGVQRPRAAAPLAATRVPPPPPTPPADPQAADKLRIKLPRRPRPASASAAPRSERSRTRSGSDTGSEARAKQEWIDFEEVPERRKQPKRIQTLPAGAVGGTGGGGVVFSYVEPEHCRCECHAHARADDQLPLLQDDMQQSRISSSSAEGADEEAAQRAPLGPASPRAHVHTHTESRAVRQ